MSDRRRKRNAAMSAEELQAVLAAFGPDGKPILADLMPTTIRTIDRWLAGTRKIQPVEAARIRSLLPPRRVT